MSGSWVERLRDRLPLRVRDVEAALREFAAAAAGHSAAVSDVAGLTARLDAMRELAQQTTARLEAIESVLATKPARSRTVDSP